MLNERQKLFCKEYVKDRNGTQAAIRAGYSEHTANEQASQLLAKLSIREEIKKRSEKKIKTDEEIRQKAIKELYRLAFHDITDIVTIETEEIEIPADINEDEDEDFDPDFDDPKGVKMKSQRVKVKDTADIRPKALAAIAGIKQGKYGIEVKMSDRTKALELILKATGGFEEHNKQKQPVVNVGYKKRD